MYSIVAVELGGVRSNLLFRNIRSALSFWAFMRDFDVTVESNPQVLSYRSTNVPQILPRLPAAYVTQFHMGVVQSMLDALVRARLGVEGEGGDVCQLSLGCGPNGISFILRGLPERIIKKE